MKIKKERCLNVTQEQLHEVTKHSRRQSIDMISNPNPKPKGSIQPRTRNPENLTLGLSHNQIQQPTTTVYNRKRYLASWTSGSRNRSIYSVTILLSITKKPN